MDGTVTTGTASRAEECLVYRLSYYRGSPSVGVHLPSLHYLSIKGACALTSLFTLFQFLKYLLCCAHDSILTCVFSPLYVLFSSKKEEALVAQGK